MNNQEEILDSGEIYKDPEDNLGFDRLDLDIQDQLNPDWKPLLARWKHSVADYSEYRKMVSKDGEIMTFQYPDEKSTIFYNALLIISFLEIFSGGKNINFTFLFFVFILMVSRRFLRPNLSFNKLTGMYKKKATIPLHRTFYKKDRITLELKHIIAIQVLKILEKEPCSCELNIVLANNTRLNILAGNDKVSLLNDAEQLAKFLDIPVLIDFEH